MSSNTFNTFNTFWKGIERNESHKGILKEIETVRNTGGLEIDEDTGPTTGLTSIDVNVTPVFKEENGERLTETNDSSIL